MSFMAGGPRDLLAPGQIGDELFYTRTLYGELAPAVYLAYDREAFFARDDRDFRITFDARVRWRAHDVSLASPPAGEELLPPGRLLMELKCGGAMPLWMARFLSQNAIYKTGFSKYGLAYQGLCRENRLETLRVPASAPEPAAHHAGRAPSWIPGMSISPRHMAPIA